MGAREDKLMKESQRRSIRLPDYDYSQAGAYFVTVCTNGRKCLFGDIADGGVRLSDAGKMVESVWIDIPKHYSGVNVDAFVAMPNHMHGIILLGVGAGPCACPDEKPKMGQPRGVAPTIWLRMYRAVYSAVSSQAGEGKACVFLPQVTKGDFFNFRYEE